MYCNRADELSVFTTWNGGLKEYDSGFIDEKGKKTEKWRCGKRSENKVTGLFNLGFRSAKYSNGTALWF